MDSTAQHNRKTNLLKALKSIRMGDFSETDTVVAVHQLYHKLNSTPKLRDGVDQWGLTPDEAHSVSINNTNQAIKSVRHRTPNFSLLKAQHLVQTHPAYQKAKVINEMEESDISF